MTLHYDRAGHGYTTKIPFGVERFRYLVARDFGYTRTEVIRDKSRCVQTASEHCESAAIDFFTVDVFKGRRLFDWAVGHADELGIQSVIFNRRVWGFGVWSERGYNGPSPHTDHVHIGLNKAARVGLTESEIRRALGQTEGDDDMTKDQAEQLRQVNEALHSVNREQIPALEKRLSDIESTLARIEATLGTQAK